MQKEACNMKKLTKILNEKNQKMTKIDFLIIGIIVLLYTVLSFINLGSFKNPQSFYQFQDDEAITFEFQESTDIIRIKFFNGDENGEYAIYTSNDNLNYTYLTTLKGNGAFAWNDERIGQHIKYLKLVSLSQKSSLGEIAFYNNSKELLTATVNSSYNTITTNLTDEQDIVPEKISYLNSSYFDEIYFARTAYDYKEGIEAYEWVHPPLGKMLQALPVILFDTMAPFYYRLMGNIAGILMVFVMYLFGKLLIKTRKWSIFASLLMFFDTFHFAHTRMGTVDSFLVLFIMLSLYFMYRYLTNKESKHDLLLSGIFFGLSICVKWTGFLGGLALAILYFTNLFKNKRKILPAILKGFAFFVFIPLIFYITVYLIYPDNQVTYTDSPKDIITQTEAIYTYHSKLEEPHFFSSKWYTWPLSYKPVWYYTNETSTTTHGTITGLGNIVIWWMGIISLPYLIYMIIKKKDKTSYWILITILSLWLPYIFIGRVMFLYHYFPVLPFIMLAVTTFIKGLEEKTKNKYIMPIYLVLVVIFFIIYFPVISGIPSSNTYIDNLKLLSSWYF